MIYFLKLWVLTRMSTIGKFYIQITSVNVPDRMLESDLGLLSPFTRREPFLNPEFDAEVLVRTCDFGDLFGVKCKNWDY